MESDSTIQRITRLTPLAAVLAQIEARVSAVAPQRRGPAAALGATLAEDVVAPELPAQPLALRDGYAVAAAAVADASAYAPIPLPAVPQKVDVGAAMPPGTDAVAPLDAIAERGDRAEAIAAVAPGEGVLPAGGDTAARTPLRRAGTAVRALDVAVMTAAGITAVSVRTPRLRLARGVAPETQLVDATLTLLGDLAGSAGGAVRGDVVALDVALADDQSDAVIAVGGTGCGRNDVSVKRLAAAGRVEAHGIAISPGETAAFGWVGERPVLLLPGRLDAVLSAWLLIGRRLIARLAARQIEELTMPLPLKRKVVSTIGLTELIPVKIAAGMAEPLAAGYLSFGALAQSDGYIVVLAESEGFAAGVPVAVIPWP